jgi:hypothetical protein
MNPDLAMDTADQKLLKSTGAGNLFMVFGEPDLELRTLPGGKLHVNTLYGVFVERNRRDDQGVIAHLGAADFPGRRAAQQPGGGVGPLHLGQQGRVFHERPAAKQQRKLRPVTQAQGRSRFPTGGNKPASLFDFHRKLSQAHYKSYGRILRVRE